MLFEEKPTALATDEILKVRENSESGMSHFPPGQIVRLLNFLSKELPKAYAGYFYPTLSQPC